jgi:hypothetical protein
VGDGLEGKGSFARVKPELGNEDDPAHPTLPPARTLPIHRRILVFKLGLH